MEDMEREWNSYNKYSELLLKGLLHKLIILCLRERSIGGANAQLLDKKQSSFCEHAIFSFRTNVEKGVCR